jgi:hypothetical protein
MTLCVDPFTLGPCGPLQAADGTTCFGDEIANHDGW